MARKYIPATTSGHTILVIDDSPEVIDSTRQLLETEGHRVLTASGGKEGLAIAAKEHPHLILVDYFMPEMTGEDVVREIRRTDKIVQIILVTGYAGEKPARLMMRQLEIQGYHDKGDGSERLLLWIDTALKAYRSAVAAEKHRVGLQYILDITPDLHRLQPLDELLQGLLWQMEGLVGAENSFLATYAANGQAADPKATPAKEKEVGAFVALRDMRSAPDEVEIRVATGRFRRGIPTRALPEPERSLVEESIRCGEISFSGGVSVLPLRLGEHVLGAMFVDRRPGFDRDRELLQIFATQAAAAIRSTLLYGENSQLYDLATKDMTTGVFLRGYVMQELEQTLKRSHRTGLPVSILMVDLDKFKQVNDNHGHIVGDAALAATGKLLQDCLRETDFVGRFGGDEFIVVLPDTSRDGVAPIAKRILEQAKGLTVPAEGEEVPIRLSIGGATIEAESKGYTFQVLQSNALEEITKELIAAADTALYGAKGKGKLGKVGQVTWPRLTVIASA
jgi:two-component system, cell cycle response regulator